MGVLGRFICGVWTRRWRHLIFRRGKLGTALPVYCSKYVVLYPRIMSYTQWLLSIVRGPIINLPHR